MAMKNRWSDSFISSRAKCLRSTLDLGLTPGLDPTPVLNEHEKKVVVVMVQEESLANGE
jgi:hypothetical protein